MGFEIKGFGLEISGAPTEREWLRFGNELAKEYHARKFALGDWANYGISTLGKNTKEMANLFGMSVTTVKFCQHVASRVERGVRDRSLSFGHHAQVADLPKKAQVKWLGDAKRNNWSIADMKERMPGRRNGDAWKFKLSVDCKDDEQFNAVVERLTAIGARWRLRERKRISSVVRNGVAR